MTQKTLFTITVVAIISSCGPEFEEASQSQVRVEGPVSQVRKFQTGSHIGTSIKLKKGKAIEVGSSAFITLEEIEDSRCPKSKDKTHEVACFWEGDVDAHFTLSVQSEGRLGSYSFNLRFHNDTSTVVSLEGFEFRIIAVDPYPIEGEEQEKEVTLRVLNVGAP